MALSTSLFGTVEKEMRLHVARLQEEQRRCDRMMERVQEMVRLNSFAVHIEHESGGAVRLTRLPSSHTQFVRCRHAVVENMKPAFFSGTPFKGISVLEIYKVDNKPLLRSFQRLAGGSPATAVKGLFCAIPADCLERALTRGCADTLAMESVFQKHWYASDDSNQAGRRVEACQTLKAPRTFSRFSTLEQLRPLLSATEAGGISPASEQVLYIALCRVYIGRLFTTSREYRGFPTMEADSPFDSLYNPLQEEYLVLRGAHVLPEFLMQYKLQPRRGVHVQLAREGVVPASLATPSVEDMRLPVWPRRLRWLAMPHTALQAETLLPEDVRQRVIARVEQECVLAWEAVRQNGYRQRIHLMRAVREQLALAMAAFNRLPVVTVGDGSIARVVRAVLALKRELYTARAKRAQLEKELAAAAAPPATPSRGADRSGGDGAAGGGHHHHPHPHHHHRGSSGPPSRRARRSRSGRG
eukprot:PLAT3890.2.p1 GENE.PLAT3890.2~~PLAT3890.2.p1  ORF type:complete len:470 (+),score=116.07 PLAT3890.2:514-1923(+)